MSSIEIDANSPPIPETAVIRRTRSAGDVGRQPAPIHRRQPPFTHSGQSDAGDDHQQLASRSTPVSMSPNILTYHRHPSTATGLGDRPTPIPVSSGERNSRMEAQIGSGSGSRRHEGDSPPTTPATHESTRRQLFRFFGLGRDASRERRSIVGLFLNILSGSAQIVTITVILALSGTRFKSPTDPNLTEWDACSRPLGIWACIWVVRALLACSLNYWGFLRERRNRQNRVDDSSTNSTQAVTTPTSRPAGAATMNTPHGSPDSRGDAPTPVVLPYALLYSRLTLLSSLLTLSWFLTAHILEYTSVNTCRHSSPHLWWLTFGILCFMYLMVLEVLLLGLVVFIIAPILFLCWNIILICIGRHPLQTTNIIKPEVGKLPRAIVDRIPLVMYIPPPPDAPLQEKVTVPKPVYGYPPNPKPSPVAASRTRFRFIRRISSPFQSKNKDSNGKEDDMESAADNDGGEEDVEKHGNKHGQRDGKQRQQRPHTWEEHWQPGEYPFVILEGNRAACAICLMDFEEPKKVTDAAGTPKPSEPQNHPLPPIPESSSRQPAVAGDLSQSEKLEITEIPVMPTTTQDTRNEQYIGASNHGIDDELKLNDAGEGAQPLRLLACGHVFHKTCLDPWLTDVSGRCPVCQRAVELPKEKSNDKRSARRPRRD